jgi:membrane-bound metal-dependent hydrolase YbcI (DUF457 family)
MPLPLGHSAIGFATHSLISNDNGRFKKWQVAIFILILSNLPDIDILIGLILQNNASVFHRGPTHSIFFALAMGFIASKFSKFWVQIPVMNFKTCFILIISHVFADYFLTDSPVSLNWPFEVSWSTGDFGWSDVLHTVFFEAVEDTGILLVCICIIILAIIFRRFYFIRNTKLAAFNILRGQTLRERKQRSIDN